MRLLLAVVPLWCGLLLALAVVPCEALAASWARGIEAIRPANALPKSDVFFDSVSCASAGNCSAVATYVDGSGKVQGLLLDETSGAWAAGTESVLPAGGSSLFDLNSVSCASAGNCSAVGSYIDGTGHTQGLLLGKAAGAWGTGVEAPLPADAAPDPRVDLESVSCASAGNCSAVGSYADGTGHRQGLLLTETAGSWTAVEEATLPPDHASDPDVSVNSVSCASAGNCSAVGNYVDGSGHGQGLLLTESGGFWALGDRATLPAKKATDPSVSLGSVSCASVGNCSAVGRYGDSSNHEQGLLLTESAGKWGTGVRAMPPADAATDPDVVVSSVSCASAGNCSAVGWYDAGSTPLQQHGLLLAEKTGAWAKGIKAIPPGTGADRSVYIDSVSCASAGNCDAVGSYLDKSGRQQGLLLAETAGAWATGVKAIMPASARPDPAAELVSVSCPSVGNCGAAGYYDDRSAHHRGLLLNTARRLTVLKAGPGHGRVTSSPAGIDCGARCSRAFASGRLVKLTATRARGSWFAGWAGACSGRGRCRVKMTAERTVTARFAPLPDTKITKAKIDKAHGQAKFRFKALGKSKGFQCALVRRKSHKKPKRHFSRCRSPKTYTSLAPGRYRFLVRAFNVGGADPTPARKSFRL